MRFPERLRAPIQAALRNAFGEVPMYLFGSRTDDEKKGGDIDIAVATSIGKAEFRSKKIQFTAEIMRRGWEIQIDVVQLSEETDALLKSEVQTTGIPLA